MTCNKNARFPFVKPCILSFTTKYGAKSPRYAYIVSMTCRPGMRLPLIGPGQRSIPLL